MSTETIYIPHHSGTVLGGHTARPWLADSAAHAVKTVWQGQPVFTSREEVFAWLAQARTTMFALMDFAVARLDADVDDRPDRGGVRRVWVDAAELVDPARQVVRASATAAGPHPSVLNALYNGVHEEAARRWTTPSAASRAIGRDPVADLVHTVWSNTYPVAWHDARHVLSDRIGHAARLLLADTDPSHDLNDATRRGLAALARTAASVGDSTAGGVPAPALTVLDDARAISTDERRGGWRHAVDRVWDTALTAAAADGVLTAATELTNAWNSRHPGGPPGPASASEQAVTGWLRRTLADSTGAVIGQWMHAAGRRPEQTTTDRALDRVSTAGRAYPSMTTIDPALRPADPPATAALAAAALRTGALR